MIRVPASLTTALVALAAIAATLGADGWARALIADRAAIADGEVWRLVTGPLVHADLGHLARDVLTLLVLGLGWGRRLGRDFGPFLAIGIAASCAAAFVDPTVGRVFGLSGATHALLVAVLLLEREPARQRGRAATALWWTLLTMVGLKVGAELVTGQLLFGVGDLGPAVWSHVAGCGLGAAYGLARWPRGACCARTGTVSSGHVDERSPTTRRAFAGR